MSAYTQTVATDDGIELRDENGLVAGTVTGTTPEAFKLIAAAPMLLDSCETNAAAINRAINLIERGDISGAKTWLTEAMRQTETAVEIARGL